MKRYPMQSFDLDYFETAPFRFVGEVEIQATPEQVFEVFEDAEAWTLWANPIQRVEWTSPKPYGLGTTRTVTMSGGMVGEEEFIAWEPGKRMAFRFTHASMNSIEAFGEDYRVTDLGDGRVRVRWTMVMAPRGISRVFLRLFGFVMSRMQNKFLKQLKALVESRYGSAA